MVNISRLLKLWLPALLIMAVIFWMSSWPGQKVKEAGLGSEGLHINGHFVLYFVLTLTFFKATKNLLLSALLALIYALGDELHQSFIPERSASIKDIFVDSAGISLAILFLWKLKQLIPVKLKSWLWN